MLISYLGARYLELIGSETSSPDAASEGNSSNSSNNPGGHAINADENDNDNDNDKPEKTPQGQTFVTTQAYKAKERDEVSFDKGVVVQVLEKNMEGWWRIKYNNHEGCLFLGFLLT